MQIFLRFYITLKELYCTTTTAVVSASNSRKLGSFDDMSFEGSDKEYPSNGQQNRESQDVDLEWNDTLDLKHEQVIKLMNKPK